MVKNWKGRVKKIKEFKLEDDDKILLSFDNEQLIDYVRKKLENKVNTLVEKIKNLNKKEKKNVVLKLKRFQKELNDELAIKKRVNLLKIRRRKLKTLNDKIGEQLNKIKMKKVMCFRCRQKGHTVANCKEEEDETNKPKVDAIDKTICYNCGSTEHSVHGCSQKINYSDLPYAVCFICKEKGHISSNCPKSDKGIYVKGGSCFVCGLKDHLAKNCPQRQLEITENNLQKSQKSNKPDTVTNHNPEKTLLKRKKPKSSLNKTNT